MALARNLGAHLHFDAEVVCRQAQRPRDAARHHLVAGFDIRNGLVEYQTEKTTDQAVAQVVMEVQRAMRTAVETRAEDHIGDLSHRDEIVHLRPIGGVVFKVAVLDHEHVAGNRGECGLHPAALAPVALVKDRTDRDGRQGRVGREDKIAVVVEIDHRSAARPIDEIGLQPLPGPVGGAVIHHDDLLAHLRQTACHRRQHGAERPAFVVDGDDD